MLDLGSIFEGRYEILAALGEGGFGTVYKARQLTTGGEVALKLMHLWAYDGEAQREKRIARFLREAQLCARLHHPNIVHLIDAGRTGGDGSSGSKIPDQGLYTVFSFAPGENLAQLLVREGPLVLREARHLMLQVLDALACAHVEGVVHRDLKPRNIMVIPTGARRNALVLDFGIGAMITSGRWRDVSGGRLTATGEALGTPGYAAPEQLRGLEPTPRADLFAWGLIFLECLTGKPVYDGSAAEIAYAQLSAAPVPLPPALERHPLGELLRPAICKDAAARDVTAAGIFAALEACDLHDLSNRGLREADGPWVLSSERAGPRAGTLSGAGEGERRHVTAVSCVVTARALAAGAGSSDADDEILRAGLALAAEIARRHRGHVAATLGDELLLYFGYPRTEEDDARRAASAALAILRAIEAEGDGLQVQIGIHAGLVVSWGDSDGAPAVGTTPRLASRLARLAPPGAVTATAAVNELLRGWFPLVAQDCQPIEDGAASMKVFCLGRGARPATERTPADPLTPFIGREQELDLLLDRWRRTRAGGGQSSLITGEPGIGKSRLLRELRERLANEAHTFAQGRCSPDTQNNALYPIVDLLGSALGLDSELTAAGRIARLEAQLAQHGLILAEAMPLFALLFSLPLGESWTPLDVSPQKHKELTQNAILALLLALTEERAVLLVVEDLHWADPTTLELLLQLVREVPSAPICLLLTARPEFSPRFSTTGVLQLHLNRLERAQIDILVARLLSDKALPPAVLEQVASRTDGVPLFVEELARMMVESGALVEYEDRYELSVAVSDVEIPSTLRALLTARLDRLGRAKETAQLAAALGREFSVEVLTAVSSRGARAVQEDLDRLISAGLVFRKRWMKQAECVFKHALVCDAAYESLPRETLKKVHARIAATLEARFPTIADARPDLLAHHHATAGQKQAAIGYIQSAAAGALHRSANAEAIGLASKGLAWLDALADPNRRVEAELGLNGVITPALMATQGWASAELKAIVDRSQTVLDALGDSPAALMPTLWALALHHHVRGTDRCRGREVAERMLNAAERLGATSDQAAAHSILGHSALIDGRLGDAQRHMEQVLALYDPEPDRARWAAYGHDIKAWAGAVLAELCCFQGDPDRGVALAEESLGWARELGHAATTGLVLLFFTLVHYHREDRDGVLARSGALLKLAAQHGLPTQVGYASVLRGWALRDLESAEQSFANLERSGAEVALPFYGTVIAEIEALLGLHAAALARLERCVRIAEERGERYYLPEMLRLEAKLRLATRRSGGEEAAEACLRRALALARDEGMKSGELRAATALGRLLLAQGRGEEARVPLEPLRELMEGPSEASYVEARVLWQEITGGRGV